MKTKFKKKAKILGWLIHEIIHPFSVRKHTFLNSEETLKRLLSNPMPFCRWGDGESAIVSGSDIHFQSHDEALAKELLECLITAKSDLGFLLGAPRVVLEQTSFGLLKNKKFKTWFKTNYLFKTIFKEPLTFGDAFLFRAYDNKMASLSLPRESLWDKVALIVVGSDKGMMDAFEAQSQDKMIATITTPPKDAYQEIDEIENKILDAYSQYHGGLPVRVLIAAGPTAKALVLRLYKQNIISYDIGHYYKYNQ